MAVPVSKQTDRDIIVAFKEQTTIGTPVSGAGAEKLRFSPSPGLVLERANVASTESRNDGNSRAPGLGRRQVTGSFNGPASVLSYDTIDAAVLRSTWTTAATVDQTNAGAITGISANVVTVTNATLLTDNLRVGQVVTLLTGFDTGDVSKHCFVTALTASTMTLVPVDGSTLTAATPSNWSLRINRNAINGTTDCAFTVEQYRGLIDKSELFEWVRFGSHGFSLAPDAEVQRQFTALGRNQTVLATGASPNFTSPTEYTTEALQSARAKLVIGSSVVVGLSQFSYTLNQNVFRDETVDDLTSDIGFGQPTLTASVTILEDDLTRVQSYLDGTETFIGLYMAYPGSAPVDFQALSFTKAKFGAATPSGLGADRFASRTFPLLVDVDERGGAYAKAMVRLSEYSA